MKTSRLFMLAMLSLAIVFITGCKKDEEPEISVFIGDWVIVNATLSQPLLLTVNELEQPLTVPAGTDITTMIQGALLGSIQCSPQNSFIELREDFSVFLSCSSSANEVDAGTWEEESETVLVINLNSTAVPTAPDGVVLTLSDASVIGDLMTATTSIPVSESMLESIVEIISSGMATLNNEVTPDSVPITFTIQLQKY